MSFKNWKGGVQRIWKWYLPVSISPFFSVKIPTPWFLCQSRDIPMIPNDCSFLKNSGNAFFFFFLFQLIFSLASYVDWAVVFVNETWALRFDPVLIITSSTVDLFFITWYEGGSLFPSVISLWIYFLRYCNDTLGSFSPALSWCVL